jgi:hypothetical protein
MDLVLPSDTIDWLLSNEVPTVRYHALRSIAKLPDDHPDVMMAKKEIMEKGPIPKMLKKQGPEGHWGNEEDFYQRSKCKGTSWSLIVLAEMGAADNDAAIKKACESVLRCSQVRSNGAFSYKGSSNKGGVEDGALSCLTSNMVWSLYHLGYAEDPRIIASLNWLVKYQRFATDPPPDRQMPYQRDRCWRPHDCRSAAVKCLRAFSAIPKKARSNEMNESINKGTEFVLSACLGVGKGGFDSVIRGDWLRIGVPHAWNTDILEIATVLKALDVDDEKLIEIKTRIKKMMNDHQCLIQNSPMADRFLTKIEKVGEPSGLLTIKAYQLFNE